MQDGGEGRKDTGAPGTSAVDIERRNFLKFGALGAAAIGAVAVGSYAVSGPSEKKTGRRLTMVIDLTRCTGCQACAIACKAEFNVRLGAFRSWVHYKEKGTFPAVQRFSLPRLCNHCAESTCSLVCPTRATYEREDGLVMIDKD